MRYIGAYIGGDADYLEIELRASIQQEEGQQMAGTIFLMMFYSAQEGRFVEGELSKNRAGTPNIQAGAR